MGYNNFVLPWRPKKVIMKVGAGERKYNKKPGIFLKGVLWKISAYELPIWSYSKFNIKLTVSAQFITLDIVTSGDGPVGKYKTYFRYKSCIGRMVAAVIQLLGMTGRRRKISPDTTMVGEVLYRDGPDLYGQDRGKWVVHCKEFSSTGNSLTRSSR